MKFEDQTRNNTKITDVEIGENVVIMMNATINIGAVIGDGTMIDMNVVLGGRATVGKNCHIGAGTVLAGVIEPPSANPVVIEDNVVIGANAVVLKDVPSNATAVGMPARIILNENLKAEECSLCQKNKIKMVMNALK